MVSSRQEELSAGQGSQHTLRPFPFSDTGPMSDSRHELTRGLITLQTLDRWDRAAPHPEILFCRGKILRQLALKADYRVARILPR